MGEGAPVRRQSDEGWDCCQGRQSIDSTCQGE
jgi:hypothetical protein